MFSNRLLEREALLLRVVRFRKLLEEARALMDLFQDAGEKAKGDYIFDRQYILSLVDKVIEQTEHLVFDAHVLAPQDSEALYKIYDHCKKVAQESFLLPSAESWQLKTPPSESHDFSDSPESRMLLEVLQWLEGSSPTGGISMLGVLKEVFDYAIAGLEATGYSIKESYPLEVHCGGVINRIDAIDLERIEDKPGNGVTLQDLHCSPLTIMIMGASDENLSGNPASNGADRRWFAALNADQLNLHSSQSGASIFLEASLMGHVSSDYIFLYTTGNSNLEPLIKAGFRLEKTERGAMAWNYDAPDRDIEQSLIELGRMLFGSSLS